MWRLKRDTASEMLRRYLAVSLLEIILKNVNVSSLKLKMLKAITTLKAKEW